MARDILIISRCFGIKPYKFNLSGHMQPLRTSDSVNSMDQLRKKESKKYVLKAMVCKSDTQGEAVGNSIFPPSLPSLFLQLHPALHQQLCRCASTTRQPPVPVPPRSWMELQEYFSFAGQNCWQSKPYPCFTHVVAHTLEH